MANKTANKKINDADNPERISKIPLWKKLRRLILQTLAWGVTIFIVLFILTVSLLSISNIPITVKMFLLNLNVEPISHQSISLDDIPSHISLIFMAAEDTNFCQHWGFDLSAIRASQVGEGASISQQTARSLLPWNANNSMTRFVESLATGIVELILSKQRIMEIYLNMNYFGNGIYGVEEASKNFFNKSIGELELEQAAELAARFQHSVLTDNSQQRIQIIYDGAGVLAKSKRSDCIEN